MANQNEIIRIGQTTVRFLLEGSDTNGLMAMFEFTVPAGARVPLPHSHTHYDETVYGLEGIITFTVNGTPVDIKPGEICFIPRGAVHGFSNNTQLLVKALGVVTPAAIGPDFFRGSAEIVNSGDPLAMEKMKALFIKYGIVPALPPQT
jgi:quercetin dioxygenase-like cupin family protein